MSTLATTARIAGARLAFLATGGALAGCAGGDEAMEAVGLGDQPADTLEQEPAAQEEVTGSDRGVVFDYGGGSIVIDISRASTATREEIIGNRVLVECALDDQTRIWPERQGERLRFHLTREGADPSEIPLAVETCSLTPLPGNPIAQARMRSG